MTGDSPYTSIKVAKDLGFFTGETIMLCDIKDLNIQTSLIKN